MSKKVNFDDTVKKMEGVTDKVNVLMRNRLIIAIFLIADGITFMFNPNGSLAEMARSIIILVLLASFSTFLANLSAKPRNLKSIIISLAVLILGIVLYIYPDLISAYIQLILSLFIIGNGLINIINTLNINRLSGLSNVISKKLDNINSDNNSSKEKNKKDEKFKDVNDNFSEGMKQQQEKLLNPLKNIVNQSNKSSALFLTLNILSVILGITLLIFPDASMVIWGLIFLYTGFSDLMSSMKAMNISKKIKERKFKDILYDEESKEDDKKSKEKIKKDKDKKDME